MSKSTWMLNSRIVTEEELQKFLTKQIRLGNRADVIHLSYDAPWWWFWTWPTRLWTRWRVYRTIRKFNAEADRHAQQFNPDA